MGRTLTPATEVRMERALEEAISTERPNLAEIARRHEVVRQTLSARYHRTRPPRARTVASGGDEYRTPPSSPRAPGADAQRISSSDTTEEADPFADIPQAPAEEVCEGQVVEQEDVPDGLEEDAERAPVSDEEIRRRIPEVRGVAYAVMVLTRGVLPPELQEREREAFEYNAAGMLVEEGWRVPFIVTFPLTCLGIIVPRVEALISRFIGDAPAASVDAPRAPQPADGDEAPEAGNVRVTDYVHPERPAPGSPPPPDATRGEDGKATVVEYSGGGDGTLADVEQLC